MRPTVLEIKDAADESFRTEYFGPILSVHVFPDAQYDAVLDQMERFAPYGLTGSIIAQDRRVIADATKRLRFAAGNFYVNDKPTGAVVGQQPFGGGRASGTNDKAGAAQNLLRWTSVRSIKETFVPPTEPHLPAHGLSLPRRVCRWARLRQEAGPARVSACTVGAARRRVRRARTARRCRCAARCGWRR